MDGARFRNKIYAGYGKAANHIGFDYDQYRPESASKVVTSCTKIGSLKVSLNQKGDYKIPNTYGVAIWWSYHDGRLTAVGDYLVGRMGTFFIAAQQDLLPIMCVACNSTASIRRPAVADGVGALGYAGDIEADDEVIMQEWPCSILMKASDGNTLHIPMDTKRPEWTILMPDIAGVVIRTSDTITDQLGRRYGVSVAELTDLGWRLTAVQLQA